MMCDNKIRNIQINQRLYPSQFNDRYYILVSLKSNIDIIINTYLLKKKDLTLVDFGCGNMPYRPIFQPYVSEYIGVDLPGNELADFYSTEDSKTELKNDIADIVISTQVLEHVKNPLDYLKECYRILKPDGIIILSTHGYWMYHPDKNDYWRWTGEGLQTIINDEGFKIMEFKGIMNLQASGLQLFQDGIMPSVPRIMKPIFAFCMQKFIGLFDKMSLNYEKKRDACVFVAVARKGGKIYD